MQARGGEGSSDTLLRRAVCAVDAMDALRGLYEAGQLQAYEENALSQTRAQIDSMMRRMKELMDMGSSELRVMSSITLLNEAITHSNRVVLAYLRLRLSHILRAVANGTTNDENFTKCLRDEERRLMNEVRSLRAEVSAAAKVPLNGPASFTSPYVQIRVLRDSGSIMTVDGQVNLAPWTIHYVRRDDIQPLILSGSVEVLGE